MADDKKWLFSTNTFLTAAKGSHENAMKQIFFHDTTLKAYMEAFPLDADYIEWYGRFHPLRETANDDYNNYYSIEATQIGQTENVKLLLQGIKGKMGKARDWYNRTSAIYAISNPARMKGIYNKGLKPFNEGGKDNIIVALSTLSKNIGADTNVLMEAIKSEVDATYGSINPSRDNQKIAKKTTRISKGTLDNSILAALEMQFGNLGSEMLKFKSDPDMESLIKSFHDMGVIQQSQQKVFTLTLKSPQIADIAARTMVFNSTLRATTKGGDVKLYLGSKPGAIDSSPVLIKDGVPLKFIAKDFGVDDYGANRYLVAVTASGLKIDFMLQLY
jgi:hypothetical protein